MIRATPDDAAALLLPVDTMGMPLVLIVHNICVVEVSQ